MNWKKTLQGEEGHRERQTKEQGRLQEAREGHKREEESGLDPEGEPQPMRRTRKAA